jgi:hypothetical protein
MLQKLFFDHFLSSGDFSRAAEDIRPKGATGTIFAVLMSRVITYESEVCSVRQLVVARPIGKVCQVIAVYAFEPKVSTVRFGHAHGLGANRAVDAAD